MTEAHGMSSTPEPTHSARSTPRVPRKRPYSRSGFYTLKTTLRTLGPRVLDKRTTLGKQLATWRDDLIQDLGGDTTGLTRP